MEPTPVPRTPVSQRIGAAAAAESKEDAADAGATVHAQLDCVDTWSTDKIETFAPAAEQMIFVRSVDKPHARSVIQCNFAWLLYKLCNSPPPPFLLLRVLQDVILCT